MGLKIARGEWHNRTLTSVSTCTVVAGSLVALNPRREVVEYTSVSSAAIGIAMHSSVDSLANPGKIVVAIPSGQECTFWAPTGTVAVSALSLGQAVGISKSGNTVDLVDPTVNSRISVIGTIYSGPYDTSTVTVVEVAWAVTQGVWFSGSSTTFLS